MCQFRFISFLLFVFLQVPDISGQSDIRFTHLRTADGLVQGYIHSMYQDHKGHLWIGTFSNMQRFNGYNFTTYTFVPDDSTSISANTVFSMAEDNNNNLWLGTERGLNLYYPETNTFKRYLHDPEDTASLGFDHIRSIVITSDNIIWLGTYGGGIDRFDPETETFTHFRKVVRDTTSLVSNFVNILYLDKDERLWIGTENGGLSCFNEETSTFTNYTHKVENPYSLKSEIVTSVVQDEDEIFWVGTWDDGLFRFDKKTGIFRQYSNSSEDPGSLPSNTIRSILIDPNENMWLATHNGLVLFDGSTGKYKNYTNDPYNNHTIISNTLASLLYTNEGILFIGSFGAGISMFDKNNNKFNVYAGNNVGNTLSSNRVWDIFENEDGKLWIATDNGISILDRQQMKYSYLLQNEDPLIKTCRKIIKDNNGYYWIGNDLGLVRYSPDLKNYQFINVQNGVYAIKQDSFGDLYFGGWNTGLLKIPSEQLSKKRVDEKSLVRFIHNPEDSNSIRDNIIWKIFEDKQNNLWVGTRLSAEIFDRKYQKFNTQVENYAAILDIMQDNQNNLWIATTGYGILKFNTQTKAIKSYSVPEGMPNNIGLSVSQDDTGELWISTEYGLCRFDPYKETFKNYDEFDGLPSAYLSLGAFELLSTGELAYGTDKGFFIFHPADLEENTIRPELELSDFLIDQKSVSIEYATVSSDIRFDKPINQIKHITLPYFEDMITFEFAAIAFSLTEKITYEYYLEGFDNSWNVIANEHKATYTNLDPGDYTFYVKAFNSDGYESSNNLQINLTIIPPFWQTWWFRTLIIIAAIVFLFGIYRLRIKFLNDRELILSQRVSERTAELEEINEEVIQQKEELQVQTGYLKEINESLENSKKELSKSKELLERKVQERTEELLLAKEKAEESDRLKSAFLANMSHEIRTPMNAVIGFASILDDQNYTDEERRFFIDQINSNSQSLLILIDDILDFSAMEAKQPIIRRKVFDLRILLDEIYKYWSLKNSNNKVQIRLNNAFTGKPLSIYSDRHRVKQIISNFVSNALKFTEKGFIELGLKSENEKIIIYVKDTGIGISPENQGVIFERFRKIEDSKDKIFRGVGLGMAISKHLAELLDIEIWLESKEHVGSTFYLAIPEKENQHIIKKASEPETEERKEFSWDQINILIVEDEEPNYHYLEKVLKNTGAKIYWAKNGKEAVGIFKSGKTFNVVLMDMKMPAMDGYEAANKIKEIVPTQTIIAQTAYAKMEDRDTILASGFDDYLSKPILPDMLLNIIQKHVC
jgi:signal transduction histidine kinase/ligand-binding sensor domain-containing protein/CheY-like chemotaxis protein